MGIGSPYFTRRFAAPSQNVLDQMQRNFPQEAAAPPPSAQSAERATVEAADRGGRFSLTPSQISAANTQTAAAKKQIPATNAKTVIPSGQPRELFFPLPSAQQDRPTNSAAKAATRP
jgi:hypothetical protein